MIVLYPDRLSPEDRSSLIALLAAEPIFAQPAVRERTRRFYLIAAGVSLYAAAISLFFGAAGHYFWSFERRAVIHSIAVVLAVVVPAIAVRAWRASVRARRAPYRCGRFLYRFGFVDARPDRIEIIEGRELDSLSVSIGRPRLSGTSRIRVLMRRGRTRRVLRFLGCDLDVPSDLAETVARGTLDVVDGYRGTRATFSSDSPRPLRDRASWVFASSVGVVASAALAFMLLSVLPARALQEIGERGWSRDDYEDVARLYPFPWVRDAVHDAVDQHLVSIGHEVDARLREPWRTELAEAVRLRRAGVRMEWFTDDDCRRSGEQELAIDGWVRDRAGGADFVSLYPAYVSADVSPFSSEYRLVDGLFDRPTTDPPPSSASAVLAVRCTIRPVRLAHTRGGVPHAIIRIDAEVTLRVGLRPPIRVHAFTETAVIDSPGYQTPFYSSVLTNAYAALRTQFDESVFQPTPSPSEPR